MKYVYIWPYCYICRNTDSPPVGTPCQLRIAGSARGSVPGFRLDWLKGKKIQEAYNVVPPSYKLVYNPHQL